MPLPPLLNKRVSSYLHAQVWDMRRSSGAVCPICHGSFKVEGDHMTLVCGHALHYSCCLEGGKDLKVCPLCRA